MSITVADARAHFKKAFPDRKISATIQYKGLYVFRAYSNDPIEGQYDPFFSVDKKTGEVRDFSIITDGDPMEIHELFMESLNN